MTDLHRHIRFTLELTFDARTDSLASGEELQSMLAHVASERLTAGTLADFGGQVRILSDRPAHIAPFVRRRHRGLVGRTRHGVRGPSAQSPEGNRDGVPSSMGESSGRAAAEASGRLDGRPSPSTERTDLRRSACRTSTTPRRRSA